MPSGLTRGVATRGFVVAIKLFGDQVLNPNRETTREPGVEPYVSDPAAGLDLRKIRL